MPTYVESWRKQGDSKKKKKIASLTMLKPLTMWVTTNCRNFVEMGVPNHLICLLRNLYMGQEATVRTRHGKNDGFKIGKGVQQGCILSPANLTSMQSALCKMFDWMNTKLESKFHKIISTSDMQMIPL